MREYQPKRYPTLEDGWIAETPDKDRNKAFLRRFKDVYEWNLSKYRSMVDLANYALKTNMPISEHESRFLLDLVKDLNQARIKGEKFMFSEAK